MERILATSATIASSMAENGLVSDGAPRVGITVETAESVYYTLSPTWRASRIHSTLSPAEKLDYYKAYDPMTGVKIAATLSGLLTMAVLYVFYKAKCKRLKFMRGSDDSLLVDQTTQQGRDVGNPALNNSSSVLYQLEVERHGSNNKLQHYCDSGRDTPASSITTQHPTLHQSTVTIKSPQYYTDDSEMPAWKVYAKELFLYGGPGLWRSASLKGSDPVLLLAQSSFDETINSRSQRTGSLSGSVMGGLGIYRCDSSRKPSSVCAYPSRSHSRLQVPTSVGTNKTCVTQLHRQRSLNRHEPTTHSDGPHQQQQQLSPFNKKNLPGRSVSFRESDMTGNYSRSKRVARSRPGSLRNSRPDYSRLRSGSCSNAEVAHLRPDSLPMTSRRASFRMPSRQTSIRENRMAARRTSASAEIPPLPPPSPNSRSVIIHRIPIHVQQQLQEESANKSMYCRSASLSSEPMTRGWRSTIAKLIRAKSTSGNSVGSNQESSSTSSPSSKHRRFKNQSSLAVDSYPRADDGEFAATSGSGGGVSGSSDNSHIDICVIQATPAASPCASIRSTLSGDSLEMATIKNIPPYVTLQDQASCMSVRDRRRCFARMKGQTIDHDNEILTIDTSFLAPPAIDYGNGAGSSSSSLLPHPLADVRSRSSSPVRHPSSSSRLQVLHNEPNLSARANFQHPTTRKQPSGGGSGGGRSPISSQHLGVSQLLPATTTSLVRTQRPSHQSISPTTHQNNTQQQFTQFPF